MRFEISASSAEFVNTFYNNVGRYNVLLTVDRIGENKFTLFSNSEVNCYVEKMNRGVYFIIDSSNPNIPSFKVKLSDSPKGLFSKTKINDIKVRLHKVVSQIKVYNKEDKLITEISDHIKDICVDIKNKLYSHGLLSYIGKSKVVHRSPVDNGHYWPENKLFYYIVATKSFTGKIEYKISFEYETCAFLTRKFEIIVTGNKSNIISNIIVKLRQECYRR